VQSAASPRVFRGFVTAFGATFVALVSHILGGGDLPGPAGIIIPLVISLPFCLALTVKKLSLFRLSLAVAVSQGLFHSLFVLGTPLPPASAVRAALLEQHAHHAAYYPGLPEGSVNLLHAGAVMWLWHVIAGIITVAYLHCGAQLAMHVKRLALGLRDLLADLRWLVVLVVTPVPTIPRAHSKVAEHPLTSQDVFHAVRRRGPPFALAA